MWIRLASFAALAASLPGCSLAEKDSGRPPAVAGPEASEVMASPFATTAPAAADWIDAAGDLCAKGLLLYPTVRLGHRADVDTVSYGLNEYARSLSRLDLPGDEPTRALATGIVARAAEVASRWQNLAVAEGTTVAERQAAAQETAGLFGALADAGAEDCAALAPQAT